MGRRAREKKLAKVEQESLDKAMAMARKKQQLSSFYAYFRRLTLTLALTIFLLWLGVFVEDRIGSIVSNLVGRG